MQHAWWEGDDHKNCALKEVAGLYHQRTRLEGNRVGLLVDPGAHDNLLGGLTANRMAEQVGTPNKQLRMSKSLQVEGVGQTLKAPSMPIALHLSCVMLMVVMFPEVLLHQSFKVLRCHRC